MIDPDWQLFTKDVLELWATEGLPPGLVLLAGDVITDAGRCYGLFVRLNGDLYDGDLEDLYGLPYCVLKSPGPDC